jgi:hypothetical protein
MLQWLVEFPALSWAGYTVNAVGMLAIEPPDATTASWGEGSAEASPAGTLVTG